MHLRIFQAADDSYHIHHATCGGCESERLSDEVSPPGEGESFATQGAVFLFIWGDEILMRHAQADVLSRSDDPVGAGTVRDITDLWTRTVFMPCTEGLPKTSGQEMRDLTM